MFDRLATHPFSYRFKDFIYAYRVENAQLKSTTEFLQPQFDERGNAYVEMFGEFYVGTLVVIVRAIKFSYVLTILILRC